MIGPCWMRDRDSGCQYWVGPHVITPATADFGSGRWRDEEGEHYCPPEPGVPICARQPQPLPFLAMKWLSQEAPRPVRTRPPEERAPRPVPERPGEQRAPGPYAEMLLEWLLSKDPASYIVRAAPLEVYYCGRLWRVVGGPPTSPTLAYAEEVAHRLAGLGQLRWFSDDPRERARNAWRDWDEEEIRREFAAWDNLGHGTRGALGQLPQNWTGLPEPPGWKQLTGLDWPPTGQFPPSPPPACAYAPQVWPCSPWSSSPPYGPPPPPGWPKDWPWPLPVPPPTGALPPPPQPIPAPTPAPTPAPPGKAGGGGAGGAGVAVAVALGLGLVALLALAAGGGAGFSENPISELWAVSKERYRASAAEKRLYGGSTVTIFYVGKKGDEHDASKWVEQAGYGPTPGERKTDAMRRAASRLGVVPGDGMSS